MSCQYASDVGHPSDGRRVGAPAPDFCNERVSVVHGHHVSKESLGSSGFLGFDIMLTRGLCDIVRFVRNQQTLEPRSSAAVAGKPDTRGLHETLPREPVSIQRVRCHIAYCQIATQG